MKSFRTGAAMGLLALEAVLAALGVSLHYGMVGEYGDITQSTVEAWLRGYSGAGVGTIALLVVVLPAAAAAALAPRRWTYLVAAGIPVLMALAMLLVTPAAQRLKLEQYDVTPQCISSEDMGPGPGTRGAEKSQEAFESVEHVGLFGGGGGSGYGGCDRRYTLTEDVDVLQHYRRVLPAAGWSVVEDDAGGLRAERDGMALEVVVCDPRAGVLWAGRVEIRDAARCEDSAVVQPP